MTPLILVDTSIWIDHYRHSDQGLIILLGREEVVLHPYVFAEIALGNIQHREQKLRFLSMLPGPEIARDMELMSLVEQQHLYGTGLGFVDVHLLASARQTLRTFVWTRDKALLTAARKLGVAFEEPGKRVQ